LKTDIVSSLLILSLSFSQIMRSERENKNIRMLRSKLNIFLYLFAGSVLP